MENPNKVVKKVKGTITMMTPINSGTNSKTNTSWTLYEVLVGDQKFRTFDRGYLNLLNKEGEWDYEEEERVSSKGTQYTSRTLLPLRRNGNGFGVIAGELKTINEKLDKIIDFFVNNETKTDEPEYFVSPPDDVPF